ncbi:MAG TPA: hypothetical protein VMV72_09245 [Verrucomicrobiae bacterium]|nr:hypothetical protein [Verrucomicrobiae bacterium]
MAGKTLVGGPIEATSPDRRLGYKAINPLVVATQKTGAQPWTLHRVVNGLWSEFPFS